MTYATAAELASWMDPDSDPPPTVPLASVLLRLASARVDEAVTARYVTDAEGMPRDARVRNALRDATLTQAEAWAANGIDPRKTTAELKRQVQSKSLSGGTLSVTYAAAQADLLALVTSDGLTALAYGVLLRAGLITTRVDTSRGQGVGVVLHGTPYDPLTGQLNP